MWYVNNTDIHVSLWLYYYSQYFVHKFFYQYFGIRFWKYFFGQLDGDFVWKKRRKLCVCVSAEAVPESARAAGSPTANNRRACKAIWPVGASCYRSYEITPFEGESESHETARPGSGNLLVVFTVNIWTERARLHRTANRRGLSTIRTRHLSRTNAARRLETLRDFGRHAIDQNLNFFFVFFFYKKKRLIER